jgi:hypothetical protein
MDSAGWPWLSQIMFSRMAMLDRAIKNPEPVDVRHLDRGVGAYNVLSSIMEHVQDAPAAYDRELELLAQRRQAVAPPPMDTGADLL